MQGQVSLPVQVSLKPRLSHRFSSLFWVTVSSAQSQRPSWKGPAQVDEHQISPGSTGPAGQAVRKEPCLNTSHLIFVSVQGFKMHQPPVLQGVHLNMIKLPLGLRSWEMEIYRLPNLHLNANAASSPEPQS